MFLTPSGDGVRVVEFVTCAEDGLLHSGSTVALVSVPGNCVIVKNGETVVQRSPVPKEHLKHRVGIDAA